MNIGEAVTEMRKGYGMTRPGWNGKGMSLQLQMPDARSKMTEPYVFMNTANGGRTPWICSQADLLDDDWKHVGPEGE